MSIDIDKKKDFWTQNTSIILDMGDFDAVKFGKWLREKRENFSPKMSVTDLAEKADVSKQYISLLERAEIQVLTNNYVQPGLDKVERLAIALDTDINEARAMAGYEELILLPFDAHEVGEGITVSFNRKSKLSNLQKKRIIDAAKLITVGIRTELADFEPVTKSEEVEGVYYDKDGYMVTTETGIKNLKKLSEKSGEK